MFARTIKTPVNYEGPWTKGVWIPSQIFVFHVVTDRREIYCPPEFDHAPAVHYFGVDITMECLSFEAIDAGSGILRTTALEVYGQPGP